jgi:hypothetical protein
MAALSRSAIRLGLVLIVGWFPFLVVIPVSLIIEIEFQRMGIDDFQLSVAVWAVDDLASCGTVIKVDGILTI